MFGVDDNGDVYVKMFKGVPRNFYSHGEITAGGYGGSQIPGGTGDYATKDYVDEAIRIAIVDVLNEEV
jgi:hypothetical protein